MSIERGRFDDSGGGSGSEDGQIGGYFITDEIRERLLQNPDCVIEDRGGRKISVLFGRQRTLEDPPWSVYCRITSVDGLLSEVVSGGRTRDDALKGVGFDVFKLVKAEEQLTQEKKGE